MIYTNMNKEDLDKLENDPMFKLAALLLGKEGMEKAIKKLQEEAKEEKPVEKVKPKKNEYVPPKVDAKPITFKTVKIDKSGFEHFVDGLCIANDSVAELEENGLRFTEDSPIIMYGNLISGLLESIFGKNVADDIMAYANGDSDLNLDNIWKSITKTI